MKIGIKILIVLGDRH